MKYSAAALVGLLVLVGHVLAAPPANDDFTAAIALTGASGSTAAGTLQEATADDTENYPSVWYKYTPTADGVARLSVDSGAWVALYGVNGPDSPLSLTSSDTKVSAYVHAGVTYHIAVQDPTFGDVSNFELSLKVGPALIQVVPAATHVEEKAGSVTIYVERVGSLTGTSSVHYATVAGSASAPPDFTAKSGTLTFAANERRKSIDIPIATDGVNEGNEQFSVKLSQPTGGLLGFDTSVVTIQDDDDDPANDAFANAVAIGGDTGSQAGTTVGADEEAGEPGGSSTVWYKWTASGGGVVKFQTQSDNDSESVKVFQGTNLADLQQLKNDNRGYLSVLAGATYYVQVDGKYGQEPFTLSWLAYRNEISVTAAPDGDQGTVAKLKLKRTGDISQAIGISVQMSDQSAHEGVDYTLPSHDFSFAAGAATLEIPYTLPSTGKAGTSFSYIDFSVSTGSAVIFDSSYLAISPAGTHALTNDNFSQAITVAEGGGNISNYAGGSTRESGEPLHTGTGLGTIWYKWTPLSTVYATISQTSDPIRVYTGTAVDALTAVPTVSLRTDGFDVKQSFSGAAGTTYYLAVETESSSDFRFSTVRSQFDFSQSTLYTKENAGTYNVVVARAGDLSTATSLTLSIGQGAAAEGIDFTVNSHTVNFAVNQATANIVVTLANDMLAQGPRSTLFTLVPASDLDTVARSTSLFIADDEDDPANNDFAAATVLPGSSGSVTGTLEGADREPGEPNHLGKNFPCSIWYKWTAPADGAVSFQHVRNSIMAAYSGAALASLNELGRADSDVAKITFSAVKNTVYYIALAGMDSNDGLDSNDGYDSNDPTLSFGVTRLSYAQTSNNGTPKIQVELVGGATLADGASIDFGSQVVGSATIKTFKVTNTGDATLTLGAITTTGAQKSEFAFSAPGSSSLGAGVATTFTITFTPAGASARAAALHLPSDDGTDASFDLVLAGSGVARINPTVTTGDATGLGTTTATLNGTVNAQGSDRAISFEYGTDTTYGASAAATPASLSSSVEAAVTASLTQLQPHTLYHYRLGATGDLGSAVGADKTFTTSNSKPVALDDTLVIVPPGGELDVLANDSDADGDTLTIVAKTAVTPPSAGKLTLTDGKLFFTASASFKAGTTGASFGYSIQDQAGGTATAQVTLTKGTLTINPSTKDIESAGGSYGVFVTSPGGFTASESVKWLSVAPLTAAGSTTVIVTVQPNPNKTPRTGTITIGDQTHTVTQAGVAAKSVIGPLTGTFAAIVGGDFSLAVPTTNGPVVYVVSGLPSGLALGNATGVITGRPKKAGSYPVTVRAKNAFGFADQTLSFTIAVVPLADGLVGTFYGLIDRSPALNGNLASRLQLTTSAAGGYSGKITTGTKSVSFKGRLDATPTDTAHATVAIALPSLHQTALLMLDDASDSLTGTLTDGTAFAPVHAWRNAWAGVVGHAADVAGYYTFLLDQVSADPALPQGFGFGAFSVSAKKGTLKLGGRLPDGSALSGSTVVGQDGQVLVYVPLYGKRGTVAGQLTIGLGASAPDDNTLGGGVTWLKPASVAKAKDTLYATGFGPNALTADGSIYTPPGSGLRVLGLPATDHNAELDFSLGGLDTEAKEFSNVLSIKNPKANGVKNTVTIATPVNQTVVSKLNASSGAFSGGFTLAGATKVLDRPAPFLGQIVTTAAGTKGYGFFLLPEPPAAGQAVKAAPKLSGSVVLQAPAP